MMTPPKSPPNPVRLLFCVRLRVVVAVGTDEFFHPSHNVIIIILLFISSHFNFMFVDYSTPSSLHQKHDDQGSIYNILH